MFGDNEEDVKKRGKRTPTFGGGASAAAVAGLQVQVDALTAASGSFATSQDVADAEAAAAAALAASEAAQAALDAAQDAAAIAEEAQDAAQEATTDTEQATQDAAIDANTAAIATANANISALDTALANEIAATDSEQLAQDARLDALEAVSPGVITDMEDWTASAGSAIVTGTDECGQFVEATDDITNNFEFINNTVDTYNIGDVVRVAITYDKDPAATSSILLRVAVSGIASDASLSYLNSNAIGQNVGPASNATILESYDLGNRIAHLVEFVSPANGARLIINMAAKATTSISGPNSAAGVGTIRIRSFQVGDCPETLDIALGRAQAALDSAVDLTPINTAITALQAEDATTDTEQAAQDARLDALENTPVSSTFTGLTDVDDSGSTGTAGTYVLQSDGAGGYTTVPQPTGTGDVFAFSGQAPTFFHVSNTFEKITGYVTDTNNPVFPPEFDGTTFTASEAGWYTFTSTSRLQSQSDGVLGQVRIHHYLDGVSINSDANDDTSASGSTAIEQVSVTTTVFLNPGQIIETFIFSNVGNQPTQSVQDSHFSGYRVDAKGAKGDEGPPGATYDDTALQASVTGLATDVSSLNTNLGAEAGFRADADTVLQGNIDAAVAALNTHEQDINNHDNVDTTGAMPGDGLVLDPLGGGNWIPSSTAPQVQAWEAGEAVLADTGDGTGTLRTADHPDGVQGLRLWSSNSDRTTGTTFDAAEAANWTDVGAGFDQADGYDDRIQSNDGLQTLQIVNGKAVTARDNGTIYATINRRSNGSGRLDLEEGTAGEPSRIVQSSSGFTLSTQPHPSATETWTLTFPPASPPWATARLESNVSGTTYWVPGDQFDILDVEASLPNAIDQTILSIPLPAAGKWKVEAHVAGQGAAGADIVVKAATNANIDYGVFQWIGPNDNDTTPQNANYEVSASADANTSFAIRDAPWWMSVKGDGVVTVTDDVQTFDVVCRQNTGNGTATLVQAGSYIRATYLGA